MPPTTLYREAAMYEGRDGRPVTIEETPPASPSAPPPDEVPGDTAERAHPLRKRGDE